jgi:hypothetical protein
MFPVHRRDGPARGRAWGALTSARAPLILLLWVAGAACAPPSATGSGAPTATALPAPLALAPSAPAPSAPSPVAATPIPPPDEPTPTAEPSGPSVAPATVPPSPAPPGPERLRVVNTEGQGANLRAEPGPTADRVKIVREGGELEALGPEREAGGRRWRNVRDPSDGATGWVVADLLIPLPASSPAGAAAAVSTPLQVPPAASPVPGPPTGGAAAAAPPSQAPRIVDADREYLAALRPHVDALGQAITAVSRQTESSSARPAPIDDPNWRSATDAAVDSLVEAARRIRATAPGPNTRVVHEHAVRAADRADEAARLVNGAVEARDGRGFAPARTALLRILSEINAMNGALLQLQ